MQWNITQPQKELKPVICNAMGRTGDYMSNKISSGQEDRYHMISVICGV